MPDIEKLMEALTLCANGKPCMGEKYRTCPYSPIGKPEYYNCGAVMAADALALLKEQEPEPAVPYNYLDAIGVVYGFKCPKCNSEIHEFQQYCDVCGMAVKWNA